MIVSLIAAFGRNRVIGKDNQIPWRLPADLKHFHDLTLGKPVVMGRKTYESILAELKTPLPERVNIVLTRNPEFQAPGCTIVGSVEEAAATVEGQHPELMVIGGEQIFKLFLPYADRLYVTQIEADFEGDAFFPKVGYDEWVVVERESHEPDKKNKYRYTFMVLEKRGRVVSLSSH